MYETSIFCKEYNKKGFGKGGMSFNTKNNEKSVLHPSIIFINDLHDFSRERFL